MNSQFQVCVLILVASLAANSQVASHAPTMKTAGVASAVTLSSNQAVVRINGATLTDRDLLREMMNVFPYARQHGGRFPKDSEGEIRQTALHNIEFEELAYQEAQRRDLTIPVSKLDRAVKDFRAQYESEEQFQQYLKSEQKGSLRELRNKIRSAS